MASLLVVFLLCLAHILEDAGKTSLLSGPARKMKRWTVSVDGWLVMFLAQEGKENTANLQVLSLLCGWIREAVQVTWPQVPWVERTEAQPCELWVCLPRGEQTWMLQL